MGMITALRITAALLGGSMNTAQLQALLGTAPGLAAWKLCASTPALAKPLATDPMARAVWLASTKAMDAMAPLSPEGAAAIAQSATHIQAIFNAAERADTWFDSATTRAAIWGSDTALIALATSSTGIARANASARAIGRALYAQQDQKIYPMPTPMDNSGARFIMIGCSAPSGPAKIYSRRAGSSVGSLVFAGSSTNVMALNGPVNVSTNAGYSVSVSAVEV